MRWQRVLSTAIAVVAVTGTLGCNDPTEPVATPGGAKLTLDVLIPARFASDPELTAHVSAWLTPGRDANRRLREVEAPLRVSDRPIGFEFPVNSDWATVQSIVVPLSPIDGHATFAVEAPVIAGVQPTIATVTIATMRLAEPDTLRLAADGSLRLHPELLAGTGGGIAPTNRQWILVITGTSAISFTVTGPLPGEIVVPRELLPPRAPSGWHVQLAVNDTYGPPALPQPGGEYDVIVRLGQLFFRTLLPAQ